MDKSYTTLLKNSFLFCLCIVLLFALTACETGTISDITDEDPGDEFTEDKVVLQGDFNQGEVQSQAEDTQEVGKVVLIYSHDFAVYEVQDGTFDLEIDRDNPAGIAFVDNNDNYLGYLTLEDGFDSIPSSFIDEDTNEIDFGTITFTGEEGSPEHNPLGDEINMTAEEQQMLAASSSFFAATFRSPDVIEKIVQGELDGFSLWFMYAYEHLYHWEWLDHNTVTYENNIGKQHVDYNVEHPFFQMHRFGVTTPGLEAPEAEVKLHYPDEWGFVDYTQSTDSPYYYHFNGIYTDHFQDEGLDIYSSHAIGGEYTFSFADQMDVKVNIPDALYTIGKENAFVAVPTLHLTEDAEGRDIIEEITWNYFTKAGKKIDTEVVESILYSGGDNPHIQEDNAIEIAVHFKKGEEESHEVEFIPADQHVYRPENDIAWEETSSDANRLIRISFNYKDLYGITYDVSYLANDEDAYDHNPPERPAPSE